jgi:flagellar motor switch protein FliN
MSADATAGIPRWVAETWAARLAESIETMTGERPKVEARAVEDASEAAAPEGALWWLQPFSIRPEAVVSLGTPEAAWLAIGRQVLASAGVESSEPAEARNTFLEISSQAFSGLSQALSARLETSVSCEGGAEASGPGPHVQPFIIEVTLGESEPLRLRLGVSAELIDILVPGEGGSAAGRAGAGADEEPAPRAAGAPKAGSGHTLELLLEVELPVSVSFGRADLPLKDVLKLATGSIVELNRLLTDPVEVIVNNCVIARGEVVVIEGNYGVRIQEIISRDSRLRSLR